MWIASGELRRRFETRENSKSLVPIGDRVGIISPPPPPPSNRLRIAEPDRHYWLPALSVTVCHNIMLPVMKGSIKSWADVKRSLVGNTNIGPETSPPVPRGRYAGCYKSRLDCQVADWSGIHDTLKANFWMKIRFRWICRSVRPESSSYLQFFNACF